MDYDSQKQLANWLSEVNRIRESSYDRDTDRYRKNFQTAMEEAGVDEDMRGVVAACMSWYGVCESFIQKYK